MLRTTNSRIFSFGVEIMSYSMITLIFNNNKLIEPNYVDKKKKRGYNTHNRTTKISNLGVCSTYF